jgi:hypothetical protein
MTAIRLTHIGGPLSFENIDEHEPPRPDVLERSHNGHAEQIAAGSREN